MHEFVAKPLPIAAPLVLIYRVTVNIAVLFAETGVPFAKVLRATAIQRGKIRFFMAKTRWAYLRAGSA